MDESKCLRVLLDERGIEHKDNDTPINGVKSYMTTWHCTNGKLVSFIETEIPHATKLRIYNPTPEQAIAATVGPMLDQDLQQALDFMRIWITDDAHLGESDISYELEKAEGLRNLEAIEQAIAATVGNRTDLVSRLREVHGLHAFAELFGFDWSDESDWSWHDVACAMADAIDSTVDADYAITFAPTLDRPPETMVGETVFDSEGNAIGWIVNATVGAGTCHIEERHGDWYCTGCGEMVGTCDTASELCIDGNAIELWRHCPQCGARIIKEEIE